MGRLSLEIESDVADFFTLRKGFLINISDFKEAERVSSLVEAYCQKCQQKCGATAPVTSLGEVRGELKNSGLSAVGTMGVADLKQCPLYPEFRQKPNGQTPPNPNSSSSA